MPRWVLMLMLVGCVGVAALAYDVRSGSSSSAATGPGKIRLTSRHISRVRIDVGRAGRGAGDTEIVRQHLFSRRVRSKPFGLAEYVCTYTARTTRACTVTFFLPRGRLMAGGSIRYPELYELAILGGTRLYDNARGTLTVIRTTRRPQRHILVFRLSG